MSGEDEIAQIRSSIRHLREEANIDAEIESSSNASGEGFWKYYGDETVPYTNFDALLQKGSLEDHIQVQSARARENNLPYCALDLFAPLESWLKLVQRRQEDGRYVLDGGVAVTLSDPRINDPKQIAKDERKGLYCISSDVFSAEFPSKLDSVMGNLGIAAEGFGLIMARPIGGIEMGVQGRELLPAYYMLLRKMWRRLSPHGGEILAPLPRGATNAEINNWKNRIKLETKAEVETDGGAFRLIKNINSSNRLPSLSDL